MNQLEDRLTNLLTRTAEAVEVRPDVDRVLDPGVVGDGAGRGRSRSRFRSREPAIDSGGPTGRRRLLLPAAASIVAAALLAAGAVALHGASRDGSDGPVMVGDPPDGWLVPTWVPEGMELWGVEWGASPGQLQGPQDLQGQPDAQALEPGPIPQLFGDPDGGRALYVTSFRYELRADTAEAVTVRGRAGQAGRSWDVEETDMGHAIEWDERGATITALYKGMSRQEAISALDTLEWRSDDPADGFAAPTGGSLPLRGEVGGGQPVGRDATFLYSQGVPTSDPAGEALGLDIRTTASSDISADYLEAWYRQGSAAGGGERPVTRYDQEWHQLTVLWPDGRSIDISPIGVAPEQLPSREILERIADSLGIATEADLGALRDATGANIEALPVLASAETSIGTIEVHGQGSFVRLCLRDLPGLPSPGPGPGPGGRHQQEAATNCATGDLGIGSSATGTATATADWTIGGAWYVAVASRGDEPEVVGGGDPSRSPDTGELPAETTTTDGDWTIRLVQPAPDIQSVCLSSEGSTTCTHQRPT